MSDQNLINSNVFLKQLNKTESLKGFRVIEDLEIKELKSNSRVITISDTVFLDRVQITLQSPQVQFNFHNVKFNKGLKIENADIVSIDLFECNIDYFSISQSNIKISLTLANNTEISNFTCKESEIANFNLIRSVISSIDFIVDTNFSTFSITNSDIVGNIKLDNVNIELFKMSKSKVGGYIWIWHSKFTNSFLLFKSTIKSYLSIEICEINEFISQECDIYNLDIVLSLVQDEKILRYACNDVSILDTKFEKDCKIFEVCNPEKEISINSLRMHFGSNSNGGVYFNSLNINSFEIFGKNFNSDITIDDSNITKFNIEDFSNYKTISIFNLKPFGINSNFSANKSNLGLTQLYFCRLIDYEKVVIKQITLTNMITSGVKWFKYKSFPIPTIRREFSIKFYIKCFFDLNYKLSNYSNTIDSFQDLRELFRQLKVVMEKQGNKVQALIFKQYEMQAYKKELKLTKSFYNLERIILWANQSNDHGQNWFKPILLGVLFTILFLLLIVISSNSELSFKPSFNLHDIRYTWNYLFQHLKFFPNFLNPAFRMEDIFKGQNFTYTFGSYFWSLIQRISISFFIYQTVTAFRKYSGK